jgi:hypothetical protein
MREEDAAPISCRSYTFARRYPLVIGKIAGWTPWWGPATPAQYVIAIATGLTLLATKGIWAHLGPLNLLVIIGLPFGLAWYVRSARIEHRSPERAMLGFLTLLSVPPMGTRDGRPARDPRPARARGCRVWVAALPPAGRDDA